MQVGNETVSRAIRSWQKKTSHSKESVHCHGFVTALHCMLQVGPWERAKKKTKIKFKMQINICTNCTYPPPLPKFLLKNLQKPPKTKKTVPWQFFIVLLYSCKGTVICFIAARPANIRQESSFPNTWLLDRHVLIPSQPRSRHLVKSCMGPKRHSPVNGLQHNT